MAALNQDGSYNGPGNAANAGSTVTLFATGEGETAPAGVDGKPAVLPLPKPLATVTVTIGGEPVEVVYVGGAPGEVAGVMQLNVKIPENIGTGSVPVVLMVGTASSRVDARLTVQ